MRDTATLTLPDHHRMARAFLALTDDPEVEAEAVQRSLVRALAALAVVLVLAFAAPVTWMAPAPASPSKVGDPPAATLGSSKAAFAAADDEDVDGGG
jgi:hypothetical protein